MASVTPSSRAGVEGEPRLDCDLVTVVVPVRDRRERMLRCLEALLAQDHPRYEVVVVDNGSTDGTAEACSDAARGRSTPVRVTRSDGGKSRVRNAGARLARGSIIAFTDSDCLPSPGWLSAGVERLLGDPSLGAVQGMTLPEPGQPLLPWAATMEIRELTGRFETCNLIVRRQALEDAGGFPEAIDWAEDTALGWNMLQAGWRAAFAPEALVHHDVTYPGFAWHLRRAQSYGEIAALFRHRPELRAERLWARCFVRPRNAKFLAALIGVALAFVDRRALLAAVPYAWFRRPRALGRASLVESVRGTLFDFAILVGMVRGSVRHRTLVL